MERWGFLFSVISSPIVYFLTLLAVCPNINPTILCAHACDVNYAACYSRIFQGSYGKTPVFQEIPQFKEFLVAYELFDLLG